MSNYTQTSTQTYPESINSWIDGFAKRRDWRRIVSSFNHLEKLAKPGQSKSLSSKIAEHYQSALAASLIYHWLSLAKNGSPLEPSCPAKIASWCKEKSGRVSELEASIDLLCSIPIPIEALSSDEVKWAQGWLGVLRDRSYGSNRPEVAPLHSDASLDDSSESEEVTLDSESMKEEEDSSSLLSLADEPVSEAEALPLITETLEESGDGIEERSEEVAPLHSGSEEDELSSRIEEVSLEVESVEEASEAEELPPLLSLSEPESSDSEWVSLSTESSLEGMEEDSVSRGEELAPLHSGSEESSGGTAGDSESIREVDQVIVDVDELPPLLSLSEPESSDSEWVSLSSRSLSEGEGDSEERVLPPLLSLAEEEISEVEVPPVADKSAEESDDGRRDGDEEVAPLLSLSEVTLPHSELKSLYRDSLAADDSSFSDAEVTEVAPLESSSDQVDSHSKWDVVSLESDSEESEGEDFYRDLEVAPLQSPPVMDEAANEPSASSSKESGKGSRLPDPDSASYPNLYILKGSTQQSSETDQPAAAATPEISILGSLSEDALQSIRDWIGWANPESMKLSFQAPIEQDRFEELLREFSLTKSLQLNLGSSQDLSILSTLSNLKELELTSLKEPTSLDFLEKCGNSLSKLTLEGAFRFTGSATQLTSLKSLSLSNITWGDESEPFWPPGLIELRLHGVKPGEFPDFKAWPKLKALVLADAARLDDLSFLYDLKSLEYLLLYHLNEVEDLTPLISLSNLKFLSLRYMANLSDISTLTNLVRLETLLLAGLSKLAQLPDCSRLVELRNLYLEFLPKLNNLLPLGQATNLESLSVGFTQERLEVPAFDHLRKHPNLKYFQLRHSFNENLQHEVNTMIGLPAPDDLLWEYKGISESNSEPGLLSKWLRVTEWFPKNTRSS